MSNAAMPPIPPLPPQTTVGRAKAGKVIVLSAVRPSDSSAPPARPARDESAPAQQVPAVQDLAPSETSICGRPMDVHSDVQQTSTVSSSLTPGLGIGSDEATLAKSAPAGRQMDVQMAAAQTALSTDRTARSSTPPSKTKSRKRKKTGLDERGRFRHTIRLEPKVEQKLRVVAEILGIDLNAAIAVCVSVHHHRLTKSGSGDS
jgi:hypothetical protein